MAREKRAATKERIRIVKGTRKERKKKKNFSSASSCYGIEFFSVHFCFFIINGFRTFFSAWLCTGKKKNEKSLTECEINSGVMICL